MLQYLVFILNKTEKIIERFTKHTQIDRGVTYININIQVLQKVFAKAVKYCCNQIKAGK